MAHDNQTAAKISGYLEKKGKLRMVSSWKKYWFVLEGRLLLYYRSKVEYEALSPCKGSITLGTPCNVKPALASSCIFQIETRSTTTTLRAESRYEQEKWMQAILAALNQITSSPTKMSHFRYSADDLVPTPTADNNKMQKPVFSRQNTMPERIGKKTQANKNVIERIQMLGGQTYGGSLNTINKIATKITPDLKNKTESSSDEGVSEENSLYARVDKAKEEMEIAERSMQSGEQNKHTKEDNEIKRKIRENNTQHEHQMHENQTENTETQRKREGECIETENEIYSRTSSIRDEEINSQDQQKCASLLLDNSEYVSADEIVKDREKLNSSECDRERSFGISSRKSKEDAIKSIERQKSSEGENHKVKELILENSEYVSADNKLLIENEHYTSSAQNKKRENIYQEISERNSFLEYASIPQNVLDQNDNEAPTYTEPLFKEKIYELPSDLELEGDKTEPALPPRPKHEEEIEQGKPKRGNTLQRLARMVSDVRKDGRKRNSFVLRMFKRIRKTEEPKLPEDADPQDDIKVLTELQKLLDNKKQIIEEKIKTSSVSEENADDCPSSGVFDDKIEYVEIDEEEGKDKDIPSLPPKQRTISEYGLSLKNTLNIPRPKLIQKPKKPKKCATEEPDEKLKTIDEILDDLDNEKKVTKTNTRQNKVKHLIEKFNDHSNYEEVELRKKNVATYENYSNRHSDDLNVLLEELIKVTNAPILAPGVTSSLISTPQPSEEWTNLVPIRKRRFSEPDYDIPRPHSSLQIIPTTVETNDNPMKPTRFFGPVLIDYNMNGDANENNISITPDSLEIEHYYHNRNTFNSSIEGDRSLFSYTSHNYSQDIRTLDKKLTKEEIYSRPKSLTSGHASLTDSEHLKSVQVKREEYEDSLEYSQTLTSF